MSTETTKHGYNSRTADKFVVRLPEGMRKKIAEVARGYHRSMNSEIISRLESSLRIDPSSGETEDEDAFNVTDENDDGDRILAELTAEEFTIIDQVRRMSPNRRASLVKLITSS